MQINILPQPTAPLLSTTIFQLYDLAPANQAVGSVGLVDQNNVIAGLNYVAQAKWASVDSPNAFAISASGAITVAQPVLNALTKATYSYVVNASDAISWGLTPITISLLLSPRPPVVTAQQVSVLDSALPGAQLSPALYAYSQQGKTLTFSLADPSGTFGVNNATGVVYVLPGAPALNWNSAPTYSLTLTVTDTSAQVAMATVTVLVTQTPKPPVFALPSFSFTASEYLASGSTVPGAVVAAYNNNTNDALVWSIASCAPLAIGGTQCPFTINAQNGQLSVAIFPGAAPLVYNASASYAAAWTVQLNVSCRDSAAVPFVRFVGVGVQIINILPRVAAASLTVSAGLAWGAQAFSVATYAYNAYALARNTYNLSAVPLTAEGQPAFSVAPTTGVVSVATTAGFNVNTKSVYSVTVAAYDTVLQLWSVPATFVVTLAHVNRAPTWNATLPTIAAPERQSGNVGAPLLSVLTDLDLALNIGEAETFSIVGGNNDTTFGIVPATGQLFVANNATPSFIYSASPAKVYYLVISVRDAGVDGPAFTANATVAVQVTVSLLLPTLSSAFYNFSFPEHPLAGSVVGPSIVGSTIVPGGSFSYSLAPSGANINQPWPFSMTTVGSGTAATGSITVLPQTVASQGPIAYSPFLGQGLFNTYTGVVTVTENRLGVGLISNSAPVQMNVLWKAENPFFSPSVVFPPASAAQLGSLVVNVYVNEHAAAGSNCSFVAPAAVQPYWVLSPATTGYAPAAVTATSKDPWAMLAYNFNAASSLFAVNSATGLLTVAGSAGNINFNTQAQYSLSLRARDTGSGLTDNATVLVNIVDVNDAAVFQGLYNSSNSSQLLAGATASISELAAPNSPVAVVRFSDADVAPLWGAKVYSLAAPSSPFFVLNATSGLLSLAPSLAGLNWNDQASFVLTVQCTDASMQPLTGSATVTVNLIQQNRVSISGFAGAPAAVGESAFAPTATQGAANDVAFSTTGSSVIISGSDFGYTPIRMYPRQNPAYRPEPPANSP